MLKEVAQAWTKQSGVWSGRRLRFVFYWGGGVFLRLLPQGTNRICGLETNNVDCCTDSSSRGGGGAATGGGAEAESKARRRAQKARMRRWAGKGTAGQPRDPPDVVEAARRLLIKARRRGVEVSKTNAGQRLKGWRALELHLPYCASGWLVLGGYYESST